MISDELFDVLAEENRRKMLDLLRQRPRSVSELVKAIGLSQPGVSKHLRIMREAGFVTVEQKGRQHIYHLRPNPLSVVDEWLEPYRAYWTQNFDAPEQKRKREEWHMLAVIMKREGGWTARFDRPMKHSLEKVWAVLTENDKLKQWMPNLEIIKLGSGGTIKFHMNDGTGSSFDIAITDYEAHSHLQYEWGDGSVRFELNEQPDGCLLVLKEFIPEVTDHTPKDLAGWHVCLDLFGRLLAGESTDFPMHEWEQWHAEYVERLKDVSADENEQE
ncbi:MAG TPA: metalloregulator ArsR/SmtB family transcription factor [Bacillales bacterium]|nr:metalloregulator ArsR/SmtB family transcription factor [Bacillales bacterium]